MDLHVPSHVTYTVVIIMHTLQLCYNPITEENILEKIWSVKIGKFDKWKAICQFLPSTDFFLECFSYVHAAHSPMFYPSKISHVQ